MISLNDIKKLCRAGSWDFVVNSRPGCYAPALKEYRWNGRNLYYRAGTADAGAFYEILIRPSRKIGNGHLRSRKLEYWVPKEINPEVILDIGGNIGTTSVFYSNMFPQAKIYTFEPVPGNFELLQKNVSGLANVSAFNVGLGDSDKKVLIYGSAEQDNTGGFSLYDVDVDKSKSEQIEVKNSATFLSEIGVDKVDLLKIDTEGAEFDILTSMDREMLSNVKWIIGELHGVRDYELFEYLSQWFDLDIRKTLRSQLFQFNARNKRLADTIPWKG